MWYEWFFDGIGTEIASLVIGLLIGAIAGYKVGIRKNGTQIQRAKDDAVQEQALEIEDSKAEVDKGGIRGNVQQIQKAGHNAKQKQTGTIK